MTRVIDFRARPNSSAFMDIYHEDLGRDPWAKFRSDRPPKVTVPEYLELVEKAGVDVTVFTGRQGVLAGPNAIDNDFVLETAEHSGGRVVGFVGIDASDTDRALDEIDRCARGGTKGFAFDPPTGLGYGAGETWDGPSMRPLLERIAELGLPVVFTMGPIVGRHGDPEPVDRLAADLPDLRIVCSHGIWPRTTELIALAFRRPNVTLETSIYLTYPGAQALITSAAQELIPDQIVYASAFPFMPLDSHRHVRALGLPNEIEDKLMFANAARLLGLEEE